MKDAKSAALKTINFDELGKMSLEQSPFGKKCYVKKEVKHEFTFRNDVYMNYVDMNDV